MRIFFEQVDNWRHRKSTLSKQPLLGSGGSSVSRSADFVVVGSPSGSACPAVAETAPSGSFQ